MCTWFRTWDGVLDEVSAGHWERIHALPEMQEWAAVARLEPEEIDELGMEF